MATIEDFRAWYERDLSRYAPWKTCVQVISHTDSGGPGHTYSELKIRIFTDKNSYSISARDPSLRTFHNLATVQVTGPAVITEAPDGGLQMMDNGYLGCTATSRRWRAGEEHHRGSDLPDGPLAEETWRRILSAIVSYELVDVVKEARVGYVPDPARHARRNAINSSC